MARHGADRTGRPAGRSGRRGRTVTVRTDDDRAVDGATVVRAVVHARLLGMRLLTLDARVVVAPADVEPTALDLMTVGALDDRDAPARPASTAATGPASADGGLRRARELLAEGTHTLSRAAHPA